MFWQMCALRRERMERLAEARKGGRREVGGAGRGENEEGLGDSKGENNAQEDDFRQEGVDGQ